MSENDIIIKVNITKMENFLSMHYYNHSIMFCPTEDRNYFNRVKAVFDILKQFEEK